MIFSPVLGITMTAAEILGISDKVGSIEEGKEANLVILDKNPFKIDPLAIKDISVLGSVFRGISSTV